MVIPEMLFLKGIKHGKIGDTEIELHSGRMLVIKGNENIDGTDSTRRIVQIINYVN